MRDARVKTYLADICCCAASISLSSSVDWRWPSSTACNLTSYCFSFTCKSCFRLDTYHDHTPICPYMDIHETTQWVVTTHTEKQPYTQTYNHRHRHDHTQADHRYMYCTQADRHIHKILMCGNHPVKSTVNDVKPPVDDIKEHGMVDTIKRRNKPTKYASRVA